jgi:pyocin large subunit-like protein
LPDPYDPQALNRYSYAQNNPVRYNDPSGHYIETALDVAFIAMDLNDIRQNPSDLWAWGALTADVACAALPIATGGGLVVRGLKAANKVDNAVDAERIITHSGNFVTKYGDDTWEALARISADVESQSIIKANPMLTGTAKHTEFKNTVKQWAEQRGGNVYVEQSIDASGNFVRGNPAGSKRPDVMEIADDGIVRIYDLKTGNAELTTKWMDTVEQRLMSTKEYNGVEFYRIKNGETTRVR